MEEFRSTHFDSSRLENEDKANSHFIIKPSIKIGSEADRENSNTPESNKFSNLSQTEYVIVKSSEGLGCGKYIVMNEDGSVKVIDQEGKEAEIIVENYDSEMDNVPLETELVGQNGQKSDSKILKSDSKISFKGCETTDTGESEDENNIHNPNFCAKENVTIVHVKNKENEDAKLVGVIVNKDSPIVEKRSVKLHIDELTCNFCQTVFTKLGNKYRHLQNVHKVKNPAEDNNYCIECDITFRKSTQLLDHIEINHSDGIDEPNISDPNFCTTENITVVRVKNEGNDSEKLVKVIVDKNPPKVKKRSVEPLADKLTCNFCKKIFTKLSNKYRHLQTVHKVKNPVEGDIRCMECNLSFRRVQQLRDHLAGHHGMNMLPEELHFQNMNGS